MCASERMASGPTMDHLIAMAEGAGDDAIQHLKQCDIISLALVSTKWSAFTED